MSDISIGIIGTGGMGTRHAMNLHNHIVGASVLGVYDLDQARAAKVAADCGGAQVFSDPHQLIHSSSTDAIIIASPDDTHAEFALVCLRVGKPVLCEKPLATNSSDALKVAEAENALGQRLISLGFMRRFDPQHVGVQQAVASGQLGRPLLFKGTSRNPSIPYGMSADAILSNSMIHDFDAMRWMMGQDVVAAYVCGVRSRTTSPSEDLLLVQLTLTNNTLASIEAYMLAEYGYDISAEVVCERGVAETLDPDVSRIRLMQQQTLPVPQDWLVRFQPAYVIEFQAWVNSLHSKQAFTGATAWDGYQAALIAEACIQALHSGKPVAVQVVAKPSLYR